MRKSVSVGLLVVPTLALAAFVSPAAPAPPAVDRPNVVFILVDDGRHDDLVVTPEIQAEIGDAGATFTQFYAPFPLCCPARATLLSGQYAHNHQVLGNNAPLGGFTKFDDTTTLATWLSPTYTTGLIGKYLNEYVPPYKPPGWDEWMVPRSMWNYTSATWSINTGTGPRNVSHPGYQTDTMGMLAEGFINRHARDVDPFFLFLSLVAPHSGIPADPDDEDVGFPTPYVKPIYRDRFAGSANRHPAFNEADISDKPVRPPPLTADEIMGLNETNAQRRESLLSVEDATRRVLNALRANGQLDNTYVIFMSDNGYFLGEHRIRAGKVAPYDISNRVPMLVRGPGIAPGTTVDQISAQVDFAATVLAMTGNEGVSGSANTDGINLLPFMTDPDAQTTREAVVLEAGPATTTSTDYRYHGVRSGDWKYVERSTGQKELCNLRTDPHELGNVAARPGFTQTPAQRDAQTQMKALLDRYRWCSGANCR